MQLYCWCKRLTSQHCSVPDIGLFSYGDVPNEGSAGGNEGTGADYGLHCANILQGFVPPDCRIESHLRQGPLCARIKLNSSPKLPSIGPNRKSCLSSAAVHPRRQAECHVYSLDARRGLTLFHKGRVSLKLASEPVQSSSRLAEDKPQ